MQWVDEFVNSLYEDFDVNDHDVQELKNEMKTHLLDAVKDLQTQGISEDESIKIAVERFGDKKQLTTGLLELFSFQKRFAKNLLRISFIFLVIGLVSWISLFIMEWNYLSTVPSINNKIATLLEHEDQISIDKEKQINLIIQKYTKIYNVAIFPVKLNLVEQQKSAEIYDSLDYQLSKALFPVKLNLVEQQKPVEIYDSSDYQLSNALYTYRKNVDLTSDNQYRLNTTHLNNKWIIQVQLMNPSDYWMIPNYLFIIFGVLFTVWYGNTIGQTRYIKDRKNKISKREALGLSMGSMFSFIAAGISYNYVGSSVNVFGTLGILFIMLLVIRVGQYKFITR